MRHRVIASVAVIAALAGTVSAEAATAKKKHVKPLCDLITDAAGDSTLQPVTAAPGVPGDDSSDIVSADIASDAKTLTAVIRLKKLANPDSQSPLGQAYYFYFNVPTSTTQYALGARIYPTGNLFVFGHLAPDPTSGLNTNYTDATGTGVVDTAKSEVRISVPLSAISSVLKLTKGELLEQLDAQAMRVLGQGVVPSQSVGPSPRIPVGGLTERMDDAVGSKSYPAGAKSCVAVGK